MAKYSSIMLIITKTLARISKYLRHVSTVASAGKFSGEIVVQNGRLIRGLSGWRFVGCDTCTTENFSKFFSKNQWKIAKFRKF